MIDRHFPGGVDERRNVLNGSQPASQLLLNRSTLARVVGLGCRRHGVNKRKLQNALFFFAIQYFMFAIISQTAKIIFQDVAYD